MDESSGLEREEVRFRGFVTFEEYREAIELVEIWREWYLYAALALAAVVGSIAALVRDEPAAVSRPPSYWAVVLSPIVAILVLRHVFARRFLRKQHADLAERFGDSVGEIGRSGLRLVTSRETVDRDWSAFRGFKRGADCFVLLSDPEGWEPFGRSSFASREDWLRALELVEEKLGSS